MQRATALTLVMAAAFFHGVTAASAAEAAEQPEAAALEVDGGPRQERVVFEEDGEIYVMNADGTGLTRLTVNDAPDYFPTFSPDGTKIAFNSDRDGNGAVYIMNADGSDERRLSPPNEEGAFSDTNAGFTPDGEWVVVTRSYRPDCEIIFFPTSGGAEESFSKKIEDAWERERPNNYDGPPPWGDIWDPVFSDDGRRVAFYVGTGDCTKALWTANVDGSGARPLVEDYVFFYTLSPDWEKVVYGAGTEKGYEFFVVNADGTGGWQLAGGDTLDFSSAFSPDGKKIIYAYYGDIYLMDADGTKRRLTSGDRYNDNPDFSPDGKKIVYESSVRRERGPVASDIYIMNVDGSERRALTQTPGDESSPRFTADGSEIVFFAYVVGPPWYPEFWESATYVMNADGSGRRRLRGRADISIPPSQGEEGP